jgi:hypothetical protein
MNCELVNAKMARGMLKKDEGARYAAKKGRIPISFTDTVGHWPEIPAKFELIIRERARKRRKKRDRKWRVKKKKKKMNEARKLEMVKKGVTEEQRGRMNRVYCTRRECGAVGKDEAIN